MEIQISSHEHPLLYEMEGPNGKAADHCNKCGKPLSGRKYGCSSCRFYIHEECLELPQEIQHFFHPCPLYFAKCSSHFNCHACHQYYSDSKISFRFECQKCNFYLDINCALAPKMNLEDDNMIQHYSHWHPLTLVHNSSSEACCEACGKLCHGTAYSCRKCKFFLHESCLEIPREIHHFFHSCRLILVPESFFRCAACDVLGYCSRLAYKCGACDFTMGLPCALKSSTIKSGFHQTLTQSEGQDRVEHLSHGHPLELIELNGRNKVYCKACQYACSDLPYCCSRCNFHLHKLCAEAPQVIDHPFHPQHRLAMVKPGQYTCHGCHESMRNVISYCCRKCKFYLGRCCDALVPSIKYDGHQHLLALFIRTGQAHRCQVCGYWSYGMFLRCVACQFDIHLYCHPSLPETIKHECHIHQLTLFRTHPEGDIADASGEFWCHACEEERDSLVPFYYCSNCKFAAHTSCVVSEILPFIPTNIQMPIGSSIEGHSAANEKETLAKLDMDIAEIRAKMDPLAARKATLEAEKEKLEAEFSRLQTDLESVSQKFEPLKEKLDALEKDRAWHVVMLKAVDKGE